MLIIEKMDYLKIKFYVLIDCLNLLQLIDHAYKYLIHAYFSDNIYQAKEDLIYLHNNNKCSCGRNGTTFKVLGRLSRVQVRGCSDSYD